MAKKIDVKVDEIPDVTTMKGYECLTPVHKLRPSVAARVVALVDNESTVSQQAGDLVAAIEEYCVEDMDGWNALFQEGGIMPIVELSLAYAVKLLGANG